VGYLAQRTLREGIDALVEKHNDQVITSRLNEIYGSEGEDSSLDPAVAALQERTLKRNG